MSRADYEAMFGQPPPAFARLERIAAAPDLEVWLFGVLHRPARAAVVEHREDVPTLEITAACGLTGEPSFWISGEGSAPAPGQVWRYCSGCYQAGEEE